MKAITRTLTPFILIAGLLTGCAGQTDSSKENSTQTENTTAVTTESVTESKESSEETENSETKSTEPETTAETESNDENTADSDNDVLVVYYSAQNHTRKAATIAADELGADIFEITPVNIYTDEDLDWTNENSRVSIEHLDESRHVELTATDVPNWDEYETVLIGYPIWWGEAAWVVDDFVKNNDFTDKTVIPFCTAYSSGIGESGELLEKMAGTGNWLEGTRFRQDFDDSDVITWADEIKNSLE